MPYREGKKWRGTVMFRGRRHTAMFPTRKEALSWERDARHQLELKESGRPSDMDLMTFCTKYLDYAKRFSFKTYDEKKTLCKRILLRWGSDLFISQITPEMVLSYLDYRAETQSNNAFNKDRKNLMAMWSWGQDFHNFPDSPLLKIKKRSHDREPQYVPPQKDVMKVLLAATRAERIFLDCYLQTGGRRSEIFRWTWVDDINFEKRKVRLGSRKSRDGSMKYRWLDMSDDLYEGLWWLWKDRKFKDSPYVWVDEHPGPNYGKPFKYRRRFMHSICERAGVKFFGFHGLRRFVGSLLADVHKVSMKKIQLILGHSNLRTTEVYVHNLDSDLKTTMDLLSTKKLENNLHDDLHGKEKEVNQE